jgi:hypothetical protein
MTSEFIVRWTPPAGSLDGRSKELMTTPFLRPLKPFKVTALDGREIPDTSIPDGPVNNMV